MKISAQLQRTADMGTMYLQMITRSVWRSFFAAIKKYGGSATEDTLRASMAEILEADLAEGFEPLTEVRDEAKRAMVSAAIEQFSADVAQDLETSLHGWRVRANKLGSKLAADLRKAIAPDA
jgi:signal transduction histidine kinase